MDQRDNSRNAVKIQGRYRTGRGVARDVVVTDLSLTGCRLFDRFCNLGADGFISIRIGSIGPIEAKVRWRHQHVAGLEFETAASIATRAYAIYHRRLEDKKQRRRLKEFWRSNLICKQRS